jgi:hypothetical protein
MLFLYRETQNGLRNCETYVLDSESRKHAGLNDAIDSWAL